MSRGGERGAARAWRARSSWQGAAWATPRWGGRPRSWKAILSTPDRFGEALELAPDLAREVGRYRDANAADRTDHRGSELLLHRLPDDRTPTRITMLPPMRQRHMTVLHLSGTHAVRKLTNCTDCHAGAAQDDFAGKGVVVPGVTKSVRPGGVF